MDFGGTGRRIQHQLSFRLVAGRCDDRIRRADGAVLLGDPPAEMRGRLRIARCLFDTQRVRGVDERDAEPRAYLHRDLRRIGKMRVDNVRQPVERLDMRDQCTREVRPVRGASDLAEIGAIARVHATYRRFRAEPFHRDGVGSPQHGVVDQSGDDLYPGHVRARRQRLRRAQRIGDVPARILGNPERDRWPLHAATQRNRHHEHR